MRAFIFLQRHKNVINIHDINDDDSVKHGKLNILKYTENQI